MLIARIIIKIMDVVLIVAAVLMLILFIGPKLLHMQTGIIKSGSMEPAIETGSWICIKEQSADTIEKGDVIAFSLKGMTVAHRVQSIENESRAFITKGDNNDSADVSPVPFQNVMGKVAFSIPKLGYLLAWVSENKIFVIAIALVYFVFSYSFNALVDLTTNKNTDRKMNYS